MNMKRDRTTISDGEGPCGNLLYSDLILRKVCMCDLFMRGIF